MIPTDPAFDNTRAFFREGYQFIGNHCLALKSEAFRTRIMLCRVVCMMGEDAARHFYDGRSFTRVGAMPQITLRLLQDKGSVQTLDGAVHAHRKRLFVELCDDEGAAALALAFEQEWERALDRWRASGTIIFHDAMVELLTGAACGWAGIALIERERAWLASGLAAMVAHAGSAGPATWAALLRRRRIERWAREQVCTARQGGAADTPLRRLAEHRDESGEHLPVGIAAVELINLQRPIVAVARFLTFAAVALHQWPDAAAWLEQDPERRSDAFAEEVRRFYPFFPVIGGRVRTPFVWHGHAFGVGDWALLGLYATNHDRRLWGDPECFRPERFLGRASSGFDLIPQGAGQHRVDHRCPGETMTRALIASALGLIRRTRPQVAAEQDLNIPLNRFPTLPRSGLRLEFRSQ